MTLRFIYESVWFFLPALVGNQFPGLTAWALEKTGRPHWNVPVSVRWLGTNKTWPAYPAAVFGAVGTAYLQQRWSDPVLVGVLFGVGIVLGDHVESFFKRRKGIPPGAKWWPFDQLDFLVGGLVLISFLLGWQVWLSALVLVPMILLLNPAVNGIGYVLGIRKVPY